MRKSDLGGNRLTFPLRTLLAFFAASLGVGSGLVIAQSGVPQNNTVIEEVIVSATKRDSGLQDTGIAISVVGSDQMSFQDLNSVEDIQNSVPGLSVGEVIGTPTVNIRGVGLNIITGLGQPGVATHYDGVYIPRTASTTTAMVDLDHVEVLRGPQGTLYGRNATGGSINFIAKHPEPEFGTGLKAGIGDYGRTFYEGYIEGPLLTDSLAVRAFLRRDSFDGYGTNQSNGEDVGDNDAKMGRIAITFQPAETLELYASYVRRDDEGSYPYNTALTTAVSLGGQEYPRAEHAFTPYDTAGNIQPASDKSTEISNLTVSWDIGDYSFKSISGYVEHSRYESFSGVAVDEFVSDLWHSETSEQWSQEFTLSGDWFEGRLQILVGAYYSVDDGFSMVESHTNIDSVTYPAPVPSGTEMILPPRPKTKDTTTGLFLDGSFSIVDELRVIFGYRYGEQVNKVTQTRQPHAEDRATGEPIPEIVSTIFINESGLLGETCIDETNEMKTHSEDPKIGLEWDITDQSMVYAQYQTGFKSGGFNITTSCRQTYKPEEVEAYEIGLKMQFLDGAITLNTAAFHYDYFEYQVEKIVGFSSEIGNAATAVSQGVEVEFNYRPTTWFGLDVAYSYLDTYYDDYQTADNFNNTAWYAQDAPIEDLHGNKLTRAPEQTTNVGLNFSTHIGKFGLGNMRLRLEAFLSDEYYLREFNRDIERQDSFEKYNVFLSFESENDLYSLELFGKNLSNEKTLAGLFAIDTVYYYGGAYEPPRTVGGSISVRF